MSLLGDERIDAQIKYIEEEVEINIESIKIDLDILHEKFKKQIMNIKKELKK
jgi:hypothetical protein